MHHQKGDTQVEEGEQLSESDDVYSLPDVTYRRAFNWTELVSRIISGLMFVAGALMLLAAGYVNQSDRDCRAQLSMWCMCEDKFPIVDPSANCQSASSRPGGCGVRRARLGEHLFDTLRVRRDSNH